MKKKKLKLYVWEDVLCDYTCGIIVVYAYNLENAKELIDAKSSYALNHVEGVVPRKIIKPEAFVVHGGG